MFYSRRKESAPGYLELIFTKDPDGDYNKPPQAIAYITDYFSNDQPMYCAHYGIMQFCGTSVSSVKDVLFTAIAEGM